VTDGARRLRRQLRRWWPEREPVAVADGTHAALEFLAACRGWPRPVTIITRRRLDAALDAPAPPRRPGRRGRPPLKGQRLPTPAARAADPTTRWTAAPVPRWYGGAERPVGGVSAAAVRYHTGLPPVPRRWVLIRDPRGQFATQALLCTRLDAAPEQILAWFVQRGPLEVTCEEARRHLGVETQRRWSDAAIGRTTPALLGLFSLVTLFAHRHVADPGGSVRQAAWYRKEHPTFADALAAVRRDLWRHALVPVSPGRTDRGEIPRTAVERLTETLCHAA